MSALPHLLHHYTSFAGLAGIVNARSVWATMIHYLNDSSTRSFRARGYRRCSVPTRLWTTWNAVCWHDCEVLSVGPTAIPRSQTTTGMKRPTT
jgi:hypothetical protein